MPDGYGKPVMFPVAWDKLQRRKPPGMMYTGEALDRLKALDGARVVKMHWRKGRFTVTYSDGHTYTRMEDFDV
jgi:hypothetical protein